MAVSRCLAIHPFSDKRRQSMAYDLKLSLYWVAGIFVVIQVAVWLAHFGLFVNLVFALSAAFMWIIIGRWLFDKPEGL